MISEPIRGAALAVALSTSLVAAPASAALVGTTSTLYLDVRSDRSLYAVQGQNVVGGPAAAYCNHCESAIAVYGDIRSYGGGLYDTSLAQQGTLYAGGNLPLNTLVTDGTTDGQRNYLVVRSPDAIYSVQAFDRDWTQPQTLFTLDGRRTATGITYDPLGQSLWLLGVYNRDGTAIDSAMHFALDGTLLGEFETLGGGALAMDYADGTLWAVRGPTQFFDQYDRNGQWLQTISVDGLGGKNGAGIEFDLAAAAAVPVPGSLSLALLATVGALPRRRRAAAATTR